MKEKLDDNRINRWELRARSTFIPEFTEIIAQLDVVQIPTAARIFDILTDFAARLGINTDSNDVLSGIKLSTQVAFGVPDAR